MRKFSFIHAADIHLDSPLTQADPQSEQMRGCVQRATRLALTRMIEAAIRLEVAFVVIAGDVFDRPVEDAGGGLWINDQFRKLTEAGIEVILIRGNHDAESRALAAIDWSAGIHELSSEQPQTVGLENWAVAVHGQSFGGRAETRDLAAEYPFAKPGCFNIGVLHTSLAGSPEHDTYAPTSLAVLEGKGYDYWALGHIHLPSAGSLSEKCYVGYSGNLQGRHVRECGPRGFHVVHVEDGAVAQVDFRACDVVRYEIVQASLETATSLTDTCDLAFAAIQNYLTDNQSWLDEDQQHCCILRIELVGATKVHGTLMRPGAGDQIRSILSERLAAVERVGIEKLKLRTRSEAESASLDLELPLKYINQVVDDALESAAERADMLQLLEELLKKARPELMAQGWDLADSQKSDEAIQGLLHDAHALLIAQLGDVEDSAIGESDVAKDQMR